MQKRFLFWNNPRDAIITLTVLLLVIGAINVFSASFVAAAAGSEFNNDGLYFLKRYAVYALGGLLVMFWLGLRGPSYKLWLNSSWQTIIWVVVLALLVLVDVHGVVANGAQRWLRIGGISVQPSEFAKLAVIMLAAGDLGQRMKRGYHLSLLELPSWQGTKPWPDNKLFIIGLVYTGLVLLQPDMGTAAIIMALVVCLYYIAGLRAAQFFGVLLTGLVGVVVAIFVAPYRMQRFLIWFNPWADAGNTGYQSVQSFMSIGSGGLFGRGWGQGSSKFYFLPEAHTDFAFSIFCQEWGFIGALLLIAIFVVLACAFFKIAMATKDAQGYLLVSGTAFLVIGQAASNMAMVSGCLPVIGVPLPFISYGGSSLLATMIAIGLTLAVYRDELRREQKKQATGQTPTESKHINPWQRGPRHE